VQLLGKTSARDVDELAALADMGFETVARLGYSSLAGTCGRCSVMQVQRLLAVGAGGRCCPAGLASTMLAGVLTAGRRAADCAGVMELQQIGDLLDAGTKASHVTQRVPLLLPVAVNGMPVVMTETWCIFFVGDHEVALCCVKRTELVQAPGDVLYTGFLREEGYI
jgi:hypothetical protein